MGIAISYLATAAVEHCRLMLARRSIESLFSSPHTPTTLREKLPLILEIRDFATRSLHLPDNGSYRCYADIGRPFATWNVFAAPRFSVDPIVWRFPIIGEVVYRGYSTLEAAERFASGLAKQGHDVHIQGSVAYSTLGWFDDPVLNTFIDYEPAEIAGLIFHELAHQQLFVKGDSFFNESFATTVEREGVRRWLRGEALAKWEHRQRRDDVSVERLLERRTTLAELYESDLPAEQKLKEKAQIGLNNAHLVRVAAYYSQLPYFEKLLTEVGWDLTKFYAAAKSAADTRNPHQKSHYYRGPRRPTNPY